LKAKFKAAMPASNIRINIAFFDEVLSLNNFIGLPPYFGKLFVFNHG
jgi:hypothetical protein